MRKVIGMLAVTIVLALGARYASAQCIEERYNMGNGDCSWSGPIPCTTCWPAQ